MAEAYRGLQYLACLWSMSSLAIVAVLTRLYTRFAITKSAGPDDATLVIALVLSIATSIGDTVSIQHGLGKGIQLISHQEASTVLKWLYINVELSSLSFFFLRTSIIIFVLRLLPNSKRSWPRRTLYLAMFANLVVTATAMVTFGLRCIPFSAIYTDVPGAQCMSKQMVATAIASNASLSCVLDYFTTLLPLLLLWRANMKRHNLIILYFFLGLGVFTASCSLGRAITAHHAAEPYGNNARTDFTWRSVPALMFNLFEQTCGIVVASLPILRQLLSSFSGHKSCLPLASACSSDASGKTRRDTTRPKSSAKGPPPRQPPMAVPTRIPRQFESVDSGTATPTLPWHVLSPDLNRSTNQTRWSTTRNWWQRGSSKLAPGSPASIAVPPRISTKIPPTRSPLMQYIPRTPSSPHSSGRQSSTLSRVAPRNMRWPFALSREVDPAPTRPNVRAPRTNQRPLLVIDTHQGAATRPDTQFISPKDLTFRPSDLAFDKETSISWPVRKESNTHWPLKKDFSRSTSNNSSTSSSSSEKIAIKSDRKNALATILPESSANTTTAETSRESSSDKTTLPKFNNYLAPNTYQNPSTATKIASAPFPNADTDTGTTIFPAAILDFGSPPNDPDIPISSIDQTSQKRQEAASRAAVAAATAALTGMTYDTDAETTGTRTRTVSPSSVDGRSRSRRPGSVRSGGRGDTVGLGMGSRAGGKTVADVRGGGADVDVDLHLDSDREEERGRKRMVRGHERDDSESSCLTFLNLESQEELR